MGLLSPWFLAGLLAVGLPLWLHLRKRHKATPVQFSSLMFFEPRVQSSVRHRRLDYLALLALRLALIGLIASAFANPFIRRPAPLARGGQRLVVLAIDDSLSMRVSNRLERAKREAASVVDGFKSRDKAEVLALSSQAQLTVRPTDDRAALRSAIAAIKPAEAHASFGELVRALRATAESSKRPLQVHLFSDMQQSSLPPAFSDLRLPADTELILHQVASGPAANWTIEQVNASGRTYGSKPVHVQATVAGFGTPKSSLRVSLALNGRIMETKSVDVPESGRAGVEFRPVEVPYGLNRGDVRVEAGDALPDDNRYLFAVERSEPRKILFVEDSRDHRSLLYFRTALDAGSQGAFVLEPASPGQAANAPLAKYALVVLSDVASVSDTLRASLEQYVRHGGGLWIALGPNSTAAATVPVIDQRVMDRRYAGRDEDRFQVVSAADAAHPSIGKANRWEGVRFYRTVHVDPESSRVVARLSDQTPLLLEKQIGEGKVLVFASTFDNVANDFPVHASFVPFVEQTAYYLGGMEQAQRALAVDSFVDLRRAGEKGESVEVIDPDGRRALTLAESAATQIFQLNREGFWELRKSNGRQELLAVNADRRESDLGLIPAETLKLWQATGRARRDAPAPVGEQIETVSFWWILLIGLLLLAIGESLFAGRYLTPEADRG